MTCSSLFKDNELDAVQESNVPFFFKQWGGKNKKKEGRELEGRKPEMIIGLVVKD